MSSRMPGAAVAAVCAGVFGCGGGPATPIAGCTNLGGHATCQVREVTETFVPRPASVLLVVERSARLLRVPPGATDSTWVAMTTGIAAALDRVWPDVDFAMLGYPSPMNTGCGEGCCYLLPANSAVRGPFGPESAARIVEVLLSDQPEGEAPTAAALATARQYLTEVDVPSRGDAFVVLVSGGGPDCNDAGACGPERCVPNLEGRCLSGGNCCADAPASCLDDAATREQIGALAAVGVATIVVALPGAAPDLAALFDELARAGGRPDPTTGGAYRPGLTAADVEATMTAILDGLGARCEALLEGALPSPDRARVVAGCDVLSGAALRPDTSAASTRLILEGPACDALAGAAPPPVNVLYGCASLP